MHLIFKFSPQISHNLCFSYLLGITAVQKENESNSYAKCWGPNKVHYGNVEMVN